MEFNSNVASSERIVLTPSKAGIFHVPQITPSSARAASELLQKNHIENHMFFNDYGYHNHIAHHLLTLFSLGATPLELERGFTSNQDYQRPLAPVTTDIMKQLYESREQVASHYSQRCYYGELERFYAGEIEKGGIRKTLNDWLFRGDEVADGLLTRMFAGFMHPLIHFGFALEFHQPAILAESLAQAAAHKNWVAPYLLGCEKAAASKKTGDNNTKRKSLIDVLHEARANDVIRKAPHPGDEHKTRDGVLGRAEEPMINVASQWTVKPTLDDLKFKTAEMVQTAFYFAAGAQNPKKIPKFDFNYVHNATSSIFYSSFVEDKSNLEVFGADEAGMKNLARLLEMKARTDLAMYISRFSPALDMDRIRNYEPRCPSQSWLQLFERARAYDDDGHVSKLVRAAANGERVCKPYERREDWPIQGDMWLKIGHMVMDSVEADGPRWVNDAGSEQAWREVPDRPAYTTETDIRKLTAGGRPSGQLTYLWTGRLA